jgi:flagellar biosynthetic protein FlhB
MADDSDDQKTEDPSQRKLDEAHDKGQFASSREVNHLFMLLGGTILVVMLAPGMMTRIGRVLIQFLDHPDQIAEAGRFGELIASTASAVGGTLVAPFALLIVLALLSGLMQHGVSFSFEPVMPNFSKVSPSAGLKRLFSMQSITELGKGMLKLVVVGAVGVYVLWPEFSSLDQLVALDPAALLRHLGAVAGRLLIATLAAVTALAIADMFYQRFRHMQSLRMSKQEVRDESRQSDGDPIVKGRLRQLRMERAKKRMMSSVPEATVVITNPTHYAIALKYVREEMDAPIVIAKGADFIALKIREIAKDNDVPIVENPPLARALYATCEINQTIKADHYKAVAEVIGYVLRLKPRTGSSARA